MSDVTQQEALRLAEEALRLAEALVGQALIVSRGSS